MALRGNLKDFSLPDVFQLVTFSKKTGVLRIRRLDGSDGSVWFRDGEVFFAQSNWRGEPLGERLVHAGKITPSALSRALDARAAEGDSGRRLGEILVDEGYITDKVLEAFVQEQIQDTIFDLMRWDEGGFDFELLPEVVSEDIGLSISIENVIMEGSRRLEEWARIKKKIPSMEIVFKMATAPGEGTFEISLKPVEWNLLLLVDGTRSVAELALETDRTDFEVSRIMYGLFSAGLLEVAPDGEVAQLRSERAEREAARAAVRAREDAERADAVREAERLEAELSVGTDADAGVEVAIESEVGLESSPAEDSPTPTEPRAEPEMPSFLADDAAPATAEDMEVFERMMGAVLEHPVRESKTQEPENAAEAPATPPVEPEYAVEATEATEAPETVEVEPPPVAEEASAWSGVEISEELTAEEAEATSVLERDLLALGLGELPTDDLLMPMGSSDELVPRVPLFADSEPEFGLDVEPETESAPSAELEAGPIREVVDEPGFVGLAEPGPESDSRIEAVPESRFESVFESHEGEPVFAAEAHPEASAIDDGEPFDASVGEIDFVVTPLDPVDAGVIDFESPEIVFTLPEEDETDASSGEAAPTSEDPDFAALLESLDSNPPEIVQTHDLEDDLDEAPLVSGGVISTDAFLADIGGNDLEGGLSGGLGAELSALTGARGVRRPTASVNRIPEPGQGVELRLDRTVDKDLVLKIIEGIRNL